MAVDRSLHTAYIMVASSISGAIFAVIYTPKALLKNLLGFTLISGMLSLLIVIIYPNIGIHQDPVWSGAWRGIFGHKNDFGPLMALGNSLVLLSLARSNGKRDAVINIFFYFVTLLLIIMSRSATALALWIILNGLVLLYFAWIKWRLKLQGKKYVYIASLSAAILGPLSLIAVILLMGKSFNLTGRVPLWVNLLKYVVSEKPWFGYGLETLWYIPEFQKWASNISGWGADVIIVVNGHNGYMDILLYLGVVGLAALCFILIQGLVRTINRVVIGRTMLDFFPLLTFVYFLTANITISYILEFESFHWLVLVTLLFLPPGKFTEQESARNG
jgi:exopolysaccharide production protein ExoQ